MYKLKKFSKAELKKQIVAKYGSLKGLKQYLKKIAKNEYGCFMGEVELYGCRIFYTSNPNHFCSFAISIPQVGSSNVLGLGKSSITKSGKQRGCSKYYLNL